MNLGQLLTWIAFLASLVTGLSWMAYAGGREGAERPARIAFRIQWLALLSAAGTLWWILFSHQFRYEYVASYSSRAMPARYVYAAFWGGQEGTFLLWAFITCSLGLVLMRVKHALTPWAMFFVNLPLVLLGFVTAMRGPFLEFAPGHVPLDGNGLNPLLQDPWMTIHPPVLFTGFSSLALPFAIGMAALVRKEWDGWIRVALPWVVFSTAILATGFTMGGVWAYKVLGWGGYWGWDPVENGSLIPWLSNTALLHGLLIQRVSGSLRRTNFFLAITSYVLVLYASFLTRSGVLADFSVHSFVNLGLNGFLLTFLGVVAVSGYGLWAFRLREMPAPARPLGHFSRESIMWLGQLVLMLMCVLTAIGMSAPLLTRLFGPPSNVQTSYYNLVNAPLAIALTLLLGLAPLMRWREQDARALGRAALPAIVIAIGVALVAMALGVRQPVAAALIFGAAFALIANLVVTARGFRAGWKHGIAYLGHTGFAILLIGIVASSGYGTSVQVQLPKDQERSALGYRMRYEGMQQDREGKNHAVVAVSADGRTFEARPAMYWSEYSQGYMKKPHIQRYAAYDLYISPLDLAGDDPADHALWLSKGESRTIGAVTYTFGDFEIEGMGTGKMHVAARVTAASGGRSAVVRPALEVNESGRKSVPAYLPGGGTVTIVSVDPNQGRVALDVPGLAPVHEGEILAVEVSTKPLINLVWIGAIVMLGSALLSMVRRILDLRRTPVAVAPPADAARGTSAA